MSWPVYAECKKSGAPWLGDVPSHWVVDRIKWSVADSQNGVWGSEPDGGSDDIRCVRVADFDRPIFRVHDREVTNRKVSASERRRRLLRRGDLILEKSGGGEKSPVGFVVLYDHSEPAVTSNFVAKVSLCQGMEPRFWTYLHHWLYVSRLTQRSIKQTSGIQNLDQQSYLDERVGFPSAREQILIANFLDRETAKIDALIGKQEDFIATLREDRAATITRAVTKGLNPKAQLSRSGQPFLGNLPTHWAPNRLGRIVKGIIDCAHSTPVEVSDGRYTVVRTTSVKNGKYEPQGSFRTDMATYQERVTRGAPTHGDIFLTREAPAGEACLVPESGVFCLGQRMVLIKSDQDTALSEFVLYALYSHPTQAYFEAHANGSTVANLTMPRIFKMPIALPPLAEQERIVEYLDYRVARVDTLIEKSTEMVEILREYRSALITNAVTGKIDVREAV